MVSNTFVTSGKSMAAEMAIFGYPYLIGKSLLLREYHKRQTCKMTRQPLRDSNGREVQKRKKTEIVWNRYLM
jgi:hypothetical protein